MKQAFTNTIRGGGGRPLTIATVKKNDKGGSVKTKKKQLLPMCAYGAACNRKECAYRHPTKPTTYENYYDDPKSKICKPFLAGLCTYGKNCMSRHPGKEEADAVRASYKQQNCSHGDGCRTEGCLYFHPWEAVVEEKDNEEFTAEELEELCAEVGELQVGVGFKQPTYDEWMANNCPPPPTMDANEAYSVWYFPGTTMQRDPYDVYALMYPQQQQSLTNLNLASQSWQPAGVCQLAPSQSWEPSDINAANFQQQQEDYYYEEDPKTFDEWKNKGCPYPSWFYSEFDPWYDDDGVRREMKEVYDLLFGSKSDETYNKQLEEQLAANPTPAELAGKSDDDHTTSAVHQQTKTAGATTTTTSTGGWASIAAKPAAPPTPTPTNIKTEASTSKTETTTSNNNNKKQLVDIPKEVWLPDTANANFFHMYPDPIERFHAVNNYHKPYLSSVKIPLCFDSNTTSSQTIKGGTVTLLDVHFQSAKTITTVLDHFLTPSLLKQNDEVWIVTGSGSHVAKGSHQKRESGGVLFNAVNRYLEEQCCNSKDHGVEFRIGRDTSAGKNKISGGAFLVRRKKS